MNKLIITPNIPGPDDFYEELLRLHEGCDAAVSNAINARLILILANHIGDRQILREAFEAAKQKPEKKLYD
ncbi:DUF2783 domain-containing protein [Aestuariivirga sp.]|jgi:hypothetical protein|uniref:DUF2783 domain-containing protein n=1 Tax=Aestuariivirga sp. TaxID=2650926 RepID=UPI0037835C05